MCCHRTVCVSCTAHVPVVADEETSGLSADSSRLWYRSAIPDEIEGRMERTLLFWRGILYNGQRVVHVCVHEQLPVFGVSLVSLNRTALGRNS